MRRRFALLLLPAAILVTTGCGGSENAKSACELVSKTAVSAQAQRLLGSGSAALTATDEETPGLSVCRYHGRNLSVRVSIDSNLRAPRRFWNRLTEQWEFYSGDEQRKPVLITGVGDDQSAFGGAGAYWVAANHQLIALSGKRIVIVTVGAGDAKPADALAAATRLARLVTRASGGEGQPARELAGRDNQVEVFAPLPGALVRSPSVVVRGAVAPETAQVRVNGALASTHPGGFFSARVKLRRGRNTIHVVASKGSRMIDEQTVAVRRGASPTEAAAQLVRASHGRLPDLRTQRLDVALAVLRALGVRHREATVQPGRVVPATWTVCSTKPAHGEQVPRGRRVLLFVAPGRFDKPSTTDCVAD
jgi:hypothetical protein